MMRFSVYIYLFFLAQIGRHGKVFTTESQKVLFLMGLIDKSSLTPFDFFIKKLHCFFNDQERIRVRSTFMSKIPITKAGFDKLKRELEHIKTVSLPENIRDIEVARAHGDITENAEYAAAKERQSFIQGKIQELENNLAMSYVVSLEGLTKDKVVFGSTVTIEDMNTGDDIKYRLVGPFESDINENTISVTSPIGKALIGKVVGDEILVKTPGGMREFEVVNISIGDADIV